MCYVLLLVILDGVVSDLFLLLCTGGIDVVLMFWIFCVCHGW